MVGNHYVIPDKHQAMYTPKPDQTSKKRLLSPESSNYINSSTPTEKKQRQFDPSLPRKQNTGNIMAVKESVPGDLTTWMARISGQLEQTVNKDDIKLLATKQDIDLINDRITAQAEEIKQI